MLQNINVEAVLSQDHSNSNTENVNAVAEFTKKEHQQHAINART